MEFVRKLTNHIFSVKYKQKLYNASKKEPIIRKNNLIEILN